MIDDQGPKIQAATPSPITDRPPRSTRSATTQLNRTSEWTPCGSWRERILTLTDEIRELEQQITTAVTSHTPSC